MKKENFCLKGKKYEKRCAVQRKTGYIILQGKTGCSILQGKPDV